MYMSVIMCTTTYVIMVKTSEFDSTCFAYTTKVGCFNLMEFGYPSCNWKACSLKCYPMQLESGLDWGHVTPGWGSSNVPACYPHNVHTVCLLVVTKVSLKAYNVSVCYQKLHKWEATWMLVTNCTPNIPMLVNNVSSKTRYMHTYSSWYAF